MITKEIRVSPKEVLLTRGYMDDVGDWLRREPGSRELFVYNATDALYALRAWGGTIVTPEGGTIDVVPGLFDDVHSENSCGEWISEQRRREHAERAPRKTLLGRLRVYDAVGRLTGRPIGNLARSEELAATRELLRQLTPAARRHYHHEIRRLRSNQALRDLRYGAAVRRLRVECGERSERERCAENPTVHSTPITSV